jgi:xylose dehydrogenase (NAD/NADP)
MSVILTGSPAWASDREWTAVGAAVKTTSQALAAGTGYPPAVTLSSHSPDRSEVRFGFLGAGGIARSALAPAVRAADGARLQAVAARSLQRAEALEPAASSYDDYQRLIEDPDVDVVYIGLDNAGHLPWTLAALRAGKHVLCEKPLGLTPADLDTMAQTALAAERLLVEAFWYRWHPRTRRLEQLLRQGALGPVQRVRTGFSFSGPTEGDLNEHYRLDPARGGGAIYDVGCYAVSAAHLALGPNLEVLGAAGRRGPTGVDLEATVELAAAGTAGELDELSPTASVHCGIAAEDRQTLMVSGQAARLEFADPVFAALNTPVDLTIITPDRAVRREHFAPVDPYRLMVEAVAGRVRGEDTFLPGLDHSRQVADTTAAWFAAL